MIAFVVASPRGVFWPGATPKSIDSIRGNSCRKCSTTADARPGTVLRSGDRGDALRLGRFVERPDAGDIIASVREIDVVDAARDAGARDVVVAGLERAAGVDDNARLQRIEACAELAMDVEIFPPARANHGHAVPLQSFDDAPSEIAGGAEDEHLIRHTGSCCRADAA